MGSFSPPQASLNSLSFSFWSEERLVGTSTWTRTMRSPLEELWRRGMPLPRRRKTVLLWVPGGILTVALPSRVGTTRSPPRAALVKLRGISQ